MKITPEQFEAIKREALDFANDNAVVVTGKTGNDYVAVPSYSTHESDGLSYQVQFTVIAIKPVTENIARATKTAKSAVAKLPAAEREALLQELLATV